MICKICGFQPKKKESIYKHIVCTHKMNPEEYYLKYVGEKGKCTSCKKETKFISINKGYCKTCSNFCKSSGAGKIACSGNGRDNWRKASIAFKLKSKGKTYEEMYGEEKATIKKEKLRLAHLNNHPTEETKLKQSILMKNKVLKGEFAPNIGNRLIHKKLKIKIGDNEYQFRSSWELKFANFLFSLNITDIGYEKLRILYYDTTKKKERVYVVDFLLQEYGLVFEIKPKNILKQQNAIDKDKALVSYCRNNNYKRLIINESDLDNNFKRIFKYVKTSKN